MEYVVGMLLLAFVVSIFWILRMTDRIMRSRQKGGRLHKKNAVYSTIAKWFLKDIPD